MGCDSGMHIFFVIILSMAFLIGNIGNGFIALVNIMDWVKRRKTSSVGQILIALAIFRITLLVSLLMSMLSSVVYPSLLMAGTVSRMIHIACIVTNHFNIWLTTCLSIFYFLKIANFSNSIFLYLRWRVKKVVLVIMLGSLILLLLNLLLTNIDRGVWDGELQRNLSFSCLWRTSSQLLKANFFTSYMLVGVPIALSLLAFLLLLFSLGKHLKKMQSNTRDYSTSAHIQALKSVFACLFICIMFFISFFVQVGVFQFLDLQFILLISVALGITFPSLHSWVIIFGNSNLRQAFVLLLSWLRCRSKIVEPMGP